MRFDGRTKTFVVPGIHAGPFNGLLSGKDVEQLWPDVAAERLGLDCGEDSGDVEFLGDLGEQNNVVGEAGPDRYSAESSTVSNLWYWFFWM